MNINKLDRAIKNSGKTKAEIAKLTGITRVTLDNALQGGDIRISILESLAKTLNVEVGYFFSTKSGQLSKATSNNSQTNPIAEPADPRIGIPLIPTEAFCGYGTPTFEDQVIEEYYYVAEFKQADFLMRVKGNSMYPKYSSGDIIACRKIQNMLFFQWNKIYAIYTNSQGVMVKRVRESARGDEYITLVSDNSNYAPFDVPRSDIAAIALVIGVIRVE